MRAPAYNVGDANRQIFGSGPYTIANPGGESIAAKVRDDLATWKEAVKEETEPTGLKLGG
jgi:hypothetical protein